jgi:hypothetical protein
LLEILTSLRESDHDFPLASWCTTTSAQNIVRVHVPMDRTGSVGGQTGLQAEDPCNQSQSRPPPGGNMFMVVVLMPRACFRLHGLALCGVTLFISPSRSG